MKLKRNTHRTLYGNGGKLPLDVLFQLGSTAFNANSFTNTGAPDVSNMTMSSAFSGAGAGFGIGNAVLPGIGGIAGGLAGGIIGGITGNSKAKKAQAEFEMEKRKERAFESKLEDARLATLMNTYPAKGADRTTLFDRGGDMLGGMLGGMLNPIAPGVKKAMGKKHESGGIDFTGPLGQDVEIEGGEIVAGNRLVFSDRLKVRGTNSTYADIAERIAETPEYITNALKQKKLMQVMDDPKVNIYKKGTATRNFQKIASPLDRLFEMQENHKSMAGVPGPIDSVNAAFGADLGAPGDNVLSRRIAMLRRDLMQKYGPEALAKLGPAATELFNNNRAVFNLPPARGLAPNGRASGVGDPTLDANLLSPGGMTIGTGAGPTQSLDPGGMTIGAVPDITATSRTNFQLPNIRGNDIERGIGTLAPFLDNIVNASLTKRTPHIPTPTYVKAPRLDTKFNIEPQLGSINRAAGARNRLLTEFNTNPQSTRANILAGTASDIDARNQLFGQKENVETQLTNQQQLLDYENQLANSNKFDNFRTQKVIRRDDIHRRTSMNAANLSEDLQMRSRDRTANMRDKQALAAIATQYADSGVIDRSGLLDIMDAIENGATQQEVSAMITAKRKKK